MRTNASALLTLVLRPALAAQLLAMGAGERARLSAMTTSSLPALRAYLAGQWLSRKARYKAARDEFKKALPADSGFAVAAIASR